MCFRPSRKVLFTVYCFLKYMYLYNVLQYSLFRYNIPLCLPCPDCKIFWFCLHTISINTINCILKKRELSKVYINPVAKPQTSIWLLQVRQGLLFKSSKLDYQLQISLVVFNFNQFAISSYTWTRIFFCCLWQ